MCKGIGVLLKNKKSLKKSLKFKFSITLKRKFVRMIEMIDKCRKGMKTQIRKRLLGNTALKFSLRGTYFNDKLS